MDIEGLVKLDYEFREQLKKSGSSKNYLLNLLLCLDKEDVRKTSKFIVENTPEEIAREGFENLGDLVTEYRGKKRPDMLRLINKLLMFHYDLRSQKKDTTGKTYSAVDRLRIAVLNGKAEKYFEGSDNVKQNIKMETITELGDIDLTSKIGFPIIKSTLPIFDKQSLEVKNIAYLLLKDGATITEDYGLHARFQNLSSRYYSLSLVRAQLIDTLNKQEKDFDIEAEDSIRLYRKDTYSTVGIMDNVEKLFMTQKRTDPMGFLKTFSDIPNVLSKEIRN